MLLSRLYFLLFFTENNEKPLSTFKIGSGVRLKVDDFLQNYELVITIRHK